MENNHKSNPTGQNESMSQQDMQQTVEMFCRAMAKIAAEEKQNQEAQNASARKNEPKTIDLVALFFRILEKLKYVVLVAVLCAVLGGVYGNRNITSYYTATAKLYVLGDNSTTINLNSLAVGSQLTMDFQEVFRTWEVHEMVREMLDLDYSYNYLQSMLTVTNPEDTRVLYITIVNPDPQLATDLANAYAEAARTFILETMDAEEPSLFSMALVPGYATTGSVRTYVMMGFLLGTVLAIGLITLLFVLDDRPRSPEDISQYTGLPTLAVIPTMGKKRRHDQLI